MIKNIIFDIGNVLTAFRWKECLEECGFSKEGKELLAKFVFQNPLWHELDRGILGDEIIIQTMRTLCASYGSEFEILLAKFPELVQERDYAAGLIRSLKEQGLHVYLLSNYSDLLFQYARERFSFLPLVDGGVISYQEQMIKPNPDIYERLLEKCGLKAQECLFFDDLADNVEEARRHGFHAVQADSERLIREGLKHYGIE